MTKNGMRVTLPLYYPSKLFSAASTEADNNSKIRNHFLKRFNLLLKYRNYFSPHVRWFNMPELLSSKPDDSFTPFSLPAVNQWYHIW